MQLRTILITLALLAFLTTLTGGAFYYFSLRESTLRESYTHSLSSTSIIKNRIFSLLRENQKSVRALAGLTELKQTLVNADEESLAESNTVLEHFRDAFNAEVCFLVDSEGNTLASSDHDMPDTHAGTNCSLRPYFLRSVQGAPAIYMAMEMYSKRRGIYFGHPVYARDGKTPAGVVVVKAPIEPLEGELSRNYDGIVLVTDPQGIIFISTRRGWLYRFLWKDSFEEAVLKNTRARDPDTGPWDWTGLVRKSEDHAVDGSKAEYLIHEMDVDGYAGWKVVYLSNVDVISKRLSNPLMKVTGYIILMLCALIGSSVLFLYQRASHDIVRRKRAEDALRESEKQLRFLSSQLLSAQEEERKRIARELHDSIGSALSAIKFSLQNTLGHAGQTSAVFQSLSGLVSMVQHAIDESRRIMTDLRPSLLDDLGIIATLGWFCRQFQTIYSNICVEERIEIEEGDVPETLKIVIFRVMQEAFHNIAKYSKAELVSLSLVKKDYTIQLTIEDNGVGFDVDSIPARSNRKRGLGLSSMKERTELSGGSFSIQSVSGEGTVVQALWPVEA